MAYKKGASTGNSSTDKLHAKVREQLYECQAQGLVPQDFIPQGDTEHGQYTSLCAKATCGWHGKYPHVQNDYQPRSERKLWGGPEPPQPAQRDFVGERIDQVTASLRRETRDLPRGDAWEPEEDVPPDPEE